jgi:hypothetical protein
MVLKNFIDYRLGGNPRYYISEQEDVMQIPDEIRKCTVFLKLRDNKVGERFVGTAFFVAMQGENMAFTYLVTAKHVIDGIEKESIDGKVLIRMNDKQGNARQIESDICDWVGHSEDISVDIKIFAWLPPSDCDWNAIPTSMIATNKIIEQDFIGIGNDLFVTGLFVGHYGQRRNTPIIRVGNIASMPEEKVKTKEFGDIEAYLIEARSIGGLSGSPVFVFLDSKRTRRVKFPEGDFKGKVFYLLGIVHGHWDRKENEIDDIISDIDGGKINTGIAVVVPATKLLEVINQPKLLQQRSIVMEKRKRENFPTPD